MLVVPHLPSKDCAAPPSCPAYSCATPRRTDFLKKTDPQNKTRANVMRERQEWVYSDTLGIARSRDGRLVLTRATREHPAFMELLCSWIRDAGPSFLKAFPFTSRAQFATVPGGRGHAYMIDGE